MMEEEKGGFFMKCPHCGVHYDDGDRECPMCGARKPAFQTDKSYLAKSNGKLARPQKKSTKTSWAGEYVTQTCAHPKKQSCPHTATLNGKKQKPKKNSKAIWIIILVVILVNLLPALFGMISDVLYDIRMRSFGISGGDVWDDFAPSPEPYSFADGDYAVFPYEGIWLSGDSSLIVSLRGMTQGQDVTEYESMLYDVACGGYIERGSCFAYPCTSDETWCFPDEFPAEEYTLWRIALTPESMEGVPPFPYTYSEGENGTLDMFQSRENPDEIYFYSPYGDTNWMDEGDFLPMSPDGDTDAQPAFAEPAQPM